MEPAKKKSTTYWRQSKVPVLKTIFGRWWWLVMPLVGLVCAEAYVAPYVADAEDQRNRTLKFKIERLEELDAEWQTVDNELVAVEMTIDTLYTPELEWASQTRDSLKAVRMQIESTFPRLEQGIALLQGQLDQLRQPIDESLEAKKMQEQAIADHQVAIRTLRDSLVTLSQEQDELRDRLYRLQHPEEFDRSRGLVSPGR